MRWTGPLPPHLNYIRIYMTKSGLFPNYLALSWKPSQCFSKIPGGPRCSDSVCTVWKHSKTGTKLAEETNALQPFYYWKRLVQVWRFVNEKASSVLQDLFSPSAGSTTGHQISRGLTVPLAQSESGRSRLAFQAGLAWNALPRSVREIKAAQQFKFASISYTLQ